MATQVVVPADLAPEQLQQHILSTYLDIRRGIAIIGIIFPFLLWIGGRVRYGLPLQDSMSAYYYTPMRDWFVGLLFVTGTFLVLYKGFSHAEDWALNIGGVLAVGVAIFPMPLEKGKEWITLHGFCAVGLFFSIAFVALFCAKDTLELIKDTKIPNPEQVIARLKKLYNGIGVAMILAVAAAYLLNNAFDTGRSTFWVEAAGILSFGFYWLVKSWELQRTQAELKTIRGETAKVGGKLMRVAPSAPARRS